MKERIKTIKSLFRFIMKRKKYWLFPVVVILLLLGLLLFVFSSSAVTPFIYTIF
ncbi:MAG: DUF5989 family protein [bacterium]